MEIILASESPRRRQLLADMGAVFTAEASEFNEDSVKETEPSLLVRRLAEGKAQAVAEAHPYSLVIGSDTVVYIDGRVLGKPKDEGDAKEMLHLLSGRTHEVYTGLAVIGQDKRTVACEKTSVTFRKLTDAEIDGYVACGEPMDKAGAYGIQGRGASLVERIEGDFYTVMGFPVCRASVILREDFGISLLERLKI